MNRLNYLLLLAVLCFSASLTAQKRYFDPIFPNVKVTQGVTYGVNATVLLIQQYGQAVPQPLKMDIYEPDGDTETARPLVIVLHTGNFLPPQVNGGCSGTVKDADDVAMAKRLASMGYVAAVADYRLGWNPIATTQTERVFTLINAAYRGVQDVRTCIRYFRKTVAEAGNPYRVDQGKIAVWGIGTGGYISLAAATLDGVADTYIPKFLTAAGPMIIEPINGDVDGTKVGIVPPTGYPWPLPGDTLCYPNHVGYSSDFNFAVNLGGALGDTSWMEAGEMPIMSFHVPSDPYAPCGTGIVNVPPPVSLPVVEVSGSCDVQALVDKYGNNNAWKNAGLNDAYTAYAKSVNGGIDGFYPFLNSPDVSGPWSFSAALEPYGVAGSNCDTNATAALAYIDTIIHYFAPRACISFGLSADCNLPVATREPLANASIAIQPNPSSGDVQFSTADDQSMQAIELFDINGRLVRTHNGINASNFTLRRADLPNGIYVAKVRLEQGVAGRKIVLE